MPAPAYKRTPTMPIPVYGPESGHSSARLRITERGALLICAATFTFITLCAILGALLYPGSTPVPQVVPVAPVPQSSPLASYPPALPLSPVEVQP